MSAKRKTWAYFDENDQFMFAAEELSKWSPKIGGKVRADGVDYTIWYIEDGRGVHNVRLERKLTDEDAYSAFRNAVDGENPTE